MSFRKILFALSLFTAVNAFAYGPYFYNGNFGEPSTKECGPIFAQKEYNTKFFLVGPTGRTAVVYFESINGTGFFDGLSLVGLFGGSNDVRVEKQMERDGLYYSLVAEGIVDSQLLYVETTVAVRKNKTDVKPFCVTKADYTGFDH